MPARSRYWASSVRAGARDRSGSNPGSGPDLGIVWDLDRDRNPDRDRVRIDA